MLSIAMTINHAATEVQLKAMLTDLGINVGTTDAQASAALNVWIRDWLRDQFRARRREPLLAVRRSQGEADIEGFANNIR